MEGKEAVAVEKLTECLTKDSQDVQVLSHLAPLLEVTDPKRAVDTYQALNAIMVEQNRFSIPLINNLAVMMFHTQDFAGAEMTLNKAIEVCNLQEQSVHEEELKQELSEIKATVQYNLGRLHEQSGTADGLDRAEELYRQVLASFPHYSDGRYYSNFFLIGPL
jgi:tetratricopeptide (TPR) repeat protein